MNRVVVIGLAVVGMMFANNSLFGESIDNVLKTENTQLGVSRSSVGLVDDMAFIRRASVDLIGRIPNLVEVHEFQSWPAATRRFTVISFCRREVARGGWRPTRWPTLFLPTAIRSWPTFPHRSHPRARFGFTGTGASSCRRAGCWMPGDNRRPIPSSSTGHRGGESCPWAVWLPTRGMPWACWSSLVILSRIGCREAAMVRKWVRRGPRSLGSTFCPFSARNCLRTSSGSPARAALASLLVCPAMNTRMWNNPAVQQNIATLRADMAPW